MQSVDPPAIVRSATVEMDQLAFEATSALEAAAKSTRDTMQRYREAGEALTKMKVKCKHGQWLPLLERHKIGRRTAQRALRVSRNWTKCDTVTHLADVYKMLSKKGEEEEIAAPPEEPLIFCRECRLNGPKKNCKKCKELRKPETEEEEPEKKREKKEAKAAAEENPLLVKVEQYVSKLARIAATITIKDIDPEDPRIIQESLDAVRHLLQAAIVAPIKGHDPRPAECRDCGQKILWVVTSKGKNMPVDPELSERGTFDIRKGVAYFVQWVKGRDMSLYQPHFKTCKKRIPDS